MATTTSHSHSLSRTSYSRPKLLRSCATAPTLVTSYASRNDRSSPNSAASSLYSCSQDKATTLLNRVASFGYACSEKSELEKRIINGSPVSRRDIGEKSGSGKSKKTKLSVQSDGEKHGAYFSFPSFEEFEGYSEREESDRESSSRRHSYR